MKVFRPNNNKHALDLDPSDEFFRRSHGAIEVEHTLCGYACEEWGYTDYTTVKKITCQHCLEVIRECKGYKL